MLTRVVVRVDGGYAGTPAVSTGIRYSVEIEGRASENELHSLVTYVDEIAEVCTHLYEMSLASFDSGAFPIVLGGDHSLGAGSVAAAGGCDWSP